MILITILAIIAVLVTIFGIAALSIGGAAFVVIFSDVIVCAVILIWIIRKMIKK